LVAAAIVNESASKAKTMVELIQSEEKEWQELDHKIKLENVA
jgi:hypothetical protein